MELAPHVHLSNTVAVLAFASYDCLKRIQVEKVIRNGLVAVLYSANYGGGWFTNFEDKKPVEPYLPMLFDTKLVDLIESGDRVELIRVGFEKYDQNARDLEIAWVPVGSLFRVTVYDGYEAVEVYPGDDLWIKA